MIALGENILLWRLHKSLSQEQLAIKSGLPRPNLSDIEKGKRDVTLSTIRSLACALEVLPGTLVNGEPPKLKDWKGALSRETMERVASSVAKERPPKHPIEYQLYNLLNEVLRCGLQSTRAHQRYLPVPTRKATHAWLHLRALYSAETVNSLIVRSLEHAERQ